MQKLEKKILSMIAQAARCPEYGPERVKALMKALDLNEKGFALLMNVTPHTVRLWTSGAVRPGSTAERLMQLYEARPEIVGTLAGRQSPEDGGAQ